MQYTKIYNKIVEYRKSNPSNNSYTEKHHIIPRCLGGDDSENNLVTVTTKEHYILHHLLIKIYPKHKGLKNAFLWIKTCLNTEKNISPYQCIRKCEYIKPLHSKETKQKISLKTKLAMTDEVCKKISERQKGERNGMFGKSYKHSEETKQKMSESSFWKGKHLYEETKRKLSESIKGRIWVNNGLIQKQVLPDNIPEGFVKGRLKRKN